MKKTKKNILLEIATLALLAACCAKQVMAGTPGSYINTAGSGRSFSRIIYAGQTNIISSPVMSTPCSAINPLPTFGCVNVGALPPGAPSTVYIQARGFPFGWSIQSHLEPNSSADEPQLESKITLTPSPCAYYELESSGAVVDAHSAVITVNTEASKGAAVWVRALEFLGTGVPADLTALEGNSKTKADMLLVGPFNLKTEDCTALTIPVTTDGPIENLYFVVNGAAKSDPFEITSCPGDLVFGCSDPVVYPSVETSGGCGAVHVTYSPSAASLPDGTTTVTATAADEHGNSAQCTFTVTKQGLDFHGFLPPISGIGGNCDAPVATFNRGSAMQVKFTANCGGVPITTGTPTLTITKCGATTPVATGNFTVVGNEWHFNWDTTGLGKGTFKLSATVSPGSPSKDVYIKIK